MKKLILLIAICNMVGCADTEFSKVDVPTPTVDTDTFCKVVGNKVICPDGSELEFKNDDEVKLNETLIKHNSCTAVSNGLYVESIQNSSIYDVYLDSSCSDIVKGELNEVCDNVEPSFGQSGSLGTNKPGAAEVCSFKNLLIFGEKQTDGLLIKILEFN